MPKVTFLFKNTFYEKLVATINTLTWIDIKLETAVVEIQHPTGRLTSISPLSQRQRNVTNDGRDGNTI